jgi:hypothetical protein
MDQAQEPPRESRFDLQQLLRELAAETASEAPSQTTTGQTISEAIGAAVRDASAGEAAGEAIGVAILGRGGAAADSLHIGTVPAQAAPMQPVAARPGRSAGPGRADTAPDEDRG